MTDFVPVSRGTGTRYNDTSDVTLDSTFTSVAGEVMIAVVFTAGSSTAPDSLTNHDGTSAWVQLGSTEVANSQSASVWGAISSGTSSTAITIQRATTGQMSGAAQSVTGLDVSGTVANAFAQTLLQGSGYVTSQALNFAVTPTNTTIEFFTANDNVTITPDSATELNNVVGYNNSCRLVSAYSASPGDDTPTATNSYQQWSRYFGLECKAAAGGASTLVADSVSYTYTPAAVNLQRGLNLVTASASYSYTVTAAGLNHGRTVAAESVSYTYTPTAITLTYAPVGNFTLTAESASYSYSVTAAALQVGRVLVSESTAYTYSVTAANLQLGSVLTTETVAYTYTVTAAVFNLGYSLATDTLGYTYTVTAVGLLTGNVLNAASLGYTYSVTDILMPSTSDPWIVQSNSSTSWAAQTDASTTYAEQTDESTTWTVQ